jgi:hypothetical protein
MADDEKTEEQETATEAETPKKKGGTNKTPAAAAPTTCRAPKCKQEVRAKGLCRKHYIAWRREDLGEHHRYKVCSREGCRKKRVTGGLCEEHAGTGAKAEGGAA